MPVTEAVDLPEPEPLGVHAILKTLCRGADFPVTTKTKESPK
jgi:hypothetical protein